MWVWTEFIWVRAVAGSCERDKETSGDIEEEKILDQLKD
jgi:hypothetical protein